MEQIIEEFIKEYNNIYSLTKEYNKTYFLNKESLFKQFIADKSVSELAKLSHDFAKIVSGYPEEFFKLFIEDEQFQTKEFIKGNHFLCDYIATNKIKLSNELLEFIWINNVYTHKLAEYLEELNFKFTTKFELDEDGMNNFFVHFPTQLRCVANLSEYLEFVIRRYNTIKTVNVTYWVISNVNTNEIRTTGHTNFSKERFLKYTNLAGLLNYRTERIEFKTINLLTELIYLVGKNIKSSYMSECISDISCLDFDDLYNDDILHPEEEDQHRFTELTQICNKYGITITK